MAELVAEGREGTAISACPRRPPPRCDVRRRYIRSRRCRRSIRCGRVMSKPTCCRPRRELGIGFVWSPPGYGPLDRADPIRRRHPRGLLCKTNPRFVGENFDRNLRLVDDVRAIGAEIGATPAQTAFAWILTRGDDIAPIPGTRRVARVEENTAADTVELNGGPSRPPHRARTSGRRTTRRSRYGLH